MAKRTIGVKVGPPEKGGRRLVITDIHGCAKTFEKLLDKVGLNQSDQLFLLGDFINRGPRSKEVLDCILELKAKAFEVYPLMGNHEEALMHMLLESHEDLLHLLKSRNSLDLLNKKGLVRKRFIQFFRSLPHFYKLDEYYLVHAGFNMKIEKPFSDVHAMCWMRNFQIKNKLKGRVVMFGHTPTKFSKIEKQVAENANSICLDNGCSHTYLGKEYSALVCLDLDSRELTRQKNVD